MSRRVLGLDRVVAVLLGLALIAGGAAALTWGAGWLRRWWPAAPARLSVADVTRESWFTAAAAGAAVVLAVLALWWLLAHVPRRGVGTLSLPGSGPAGQSRVTASGPVDAAAEEFALTPGVRSASGRTISDRGELLVEFRAVVEPTADLRTVAAASQEVSAQLRQVLGREDVRGRVRLSVARTDKTRRVH